VLRDFLFSDQGMLAMPREENKKDHCRRKAAGDFVAKAPKLRIMK
jgi:hypothetical protein